MANIQKHIDYDGICLSLRLLRPYPGIFNQCKNLDFNAVARFFPRICLGADCLATSLTNMTVSLGIWFMAGYFPVPGMALICVYYEPEREDLVAPGLESV